MLTTQEIFTKVRNHLLSQNMKSRKYDHVNDEPMCMYRNGAGMMCAVGCLITDAAYDVSLEGVGAHEPEVSQMLINSGIDMNDENTANLVCSLQLMHDNTDVNKWSARLIDIAGSYGLIVEGSK